MNLKSETQATAADDGMTEHPEGDEVSSLGKAMKITRTRSTKTTRGMKLRQDLLFKGWRIGKVTLWSIVLYKVVTG